MLAATSRSKKRRLNPRAESSLSKKETAKIGIVGEKQLVKKIKKKLSILNVELVDLLPTERLNDQRVKGKNITGIIFAEEKWGGHECKNFIRENKGKLENFPKVYILKSVSNQRARRLYDQGMSLVLDIKKESRLMASLIAQGLGFHFVAGQSRTPDRSLARVVTSHLRTLRPIYGKLKVKAKEGGVEVTGSVSDLWKKTEIRKCLEGIPGVRNIDLQSLNVITAAISDKKLRASIAKVIQAQPFVDHRTISYSVRRGHVVLAGKCISSEALSKLISTLEHFSGLKSIENNIVIEYSGFQNDLLKASRLNEGLSLLFPGQKLEVSVFGRNVCVRGRCKTLLQKNEILDYLKRQSPSSKLIDKLIC